MRVRALRVVLVAQSDAPDCEQLYIAGVAVGELNGSGARGLQGCMLVSRGHEVHKHTSMRALQFALLNHRNRAAGSLWLLSAIYDNGLASQVAS